MRALLTSGARTINGWLCLLIIAVVTKASAAQDTTSGELPAPFEASGSLIGVAVNLALVLAAIVLLAWLFRRFQGVGQSAAGQLRVSATLPLGPRERILLVTVGNEQIVVGASSAGLRTLHVLDTPLAEAGAEPVTPGESFRERLAKSLGRTSA